MSALTGTGRPCSRSCATCAGANRCRATTTLTPEQIAAALAGADAKTVKAVRDYERKFQHRQSVLDEAARVLPASRASAEEERAREEKAALLREGYADRERTAPDPPE